MLCAARRGARVLRASGARLLPRCCLLMLRAYYARYGARRARHVCRFAAAAMIAMRQFRAASAARAVSPPRAADAAPVCRAAPARERVATRLPARRGVAKYAMMLSLPKPRPARMLDDAAPPTITPLAACRCFTPLLSPILMFLYTVLSPLMLHVGAVLCFCVPAPLHHASACR